MQHHTIAIVDNRILPIKEKIFRMVAGMEEEITPVVPFLAPSTVSERLRSPWCWT